MSPPFPPEILCEIALHLPLTEDVIALSLTSHAVRAALSTPALFKARLLLQRWDIDAWQDEDDKVQRSLDWKRWIRIDYIHSKTLQLLEEASSGGLSPSPVESESSSPSPSPELLSIRNTRIHMGKAEHWSRRMSKVFPMLIAHHRVNNILLLTQTKYCDAFRAYLMVVTQSYLPTPTQQSHEFPVRLSVGLLERACFGLAAFLMQCNTKTIESIFGGAWTVDGSPDFVAGLFSELRLGAIVLVYSIRNAKALVEILENSRRYITGFLIQIKIHLRLHFEAARSPLSLLPPSIPPMNPASQYDGPYELGSTATLWPWLRDGLAGTPIAGLSSASDHRWAGYYTFSNMYEGMHNSDPPMFFKLHLAPPPTAVEAAYKVYFCGEGADAVGPFTLEGSSDKQTGVVIARKTYVGAHGWDWYGMITPFGMVGVWGIGPDTLGWWWIWRQEWSERSTAPTATVTE